jgi:hypothetical protein
MRAVVAVAIAITSIAVPAAQETRPVPKDSVRVYLTGCAKGRVFTAGPRLEDPPSNAEVREGTHLRMNGAKKLMEEIKAHEKSSMMFGITGLMKKGQYGPGGVSIGGVRIAPQGSPSGPSASIGGAGIDQTSIDVESVRPVAGRCPAR